MVMADSSPSEPSSVSLMQQSQQSQLQDVVVHVSEAPVAGDLSHSTASDEVDVSNVMFSTGQSAAPPSYDEANTPIDPPPSYDSLFGRVCQVRKSSNNLFSFIRNLFFFLLGKSLMVMYGITLIIPVCMLVIGSIYFNDCPAENYIPIGLIVGGGFGLVNQFLNLKFRSEQARQAELEVPDSSLSAAVHSLINSFLLCWFLTGCYWVYHVYQPNYSNPSDPNFCSYVLYSFAFWLLTSVYIFGAAVIILLCIISSTAHIFTRGR